MTSAMSCVSSETYAATYFGARSWLYLYAGTFHVWADTLHGLICKWLLHFADLRIHCWCILGL